MLAARRRISELVHRWMQPGSLEIVTVHVIWGSTSLIIRWVAMPAIAITFYRYFSATLLLLAYGVCSGHLYQLFVCRRRRDLVILCAFFSLASMAYTAAVQYTSVANALLFGWIPPLLVPLLGARYLGEPVRARAVMALGLGSIGAALMVLPEAHFVGIRDVAGLTFALVSGMGIVVWIVGLKAIGKVVSDYTMLTYRCIVATLIAIPMTLAGALTPTLIQGGLLATLGMLHTAITPLIFLQAMRKIEAQDVVVLTYAEPLAATILAWFFLGEHLRWHSIAGGALILGGNYLAAAMREG